MSTDKNIAYILSLVIFLLITSCDTLYIKKAHIHMRDSIYNKKQLELYNCDISHIVSIVDKILEEENIHEKRDIRRNEYGVVTMYYFGAYNIHNTVIKNIRVKVIANYNKGYLDIELADIFNNSQSELSKNIQESLTTEIKKMYREEITWSN